MLNGRMRVLDACAAKRADSMCLHAQLNIVHVGIREDNG